MNYNFITYRYELIFILVVLLFFVGGSLVKIWWNKIMGHVRKLRVLQLEIHNVQDFQKCISALVPPFVFEIAVHQLGEEKAYYLIVPEKQLDMVTKMVSPFVKSEVVDDYSFFHTKGVNRGFLVSGKLEHEVSQTISFQDAISMIASLDFHTLNEIGEGVMVQCLVRRTVGEHFEVNARLVVSGPTKEATDESVSSIQASLPKQYQLAEVSEKVFFEAIAMRGFDKEKTYLWKR
jgi:hypothetical protein